MLTFYMTSFLITKSSIKMKLKVSNIKLKEKCLIKDQLKQTFQTINVMEHKTILLLDQMNANLNLKNQQQSKIK